MIDISSNIAGIKRRLVLTKFFDCFLDSILISLIISGILLAFGASVFYSFILAGAYLAFGFFKSAKMSSLGEIEKKIPGLEWQLRTASDNAEKRNEIVDKLKQDVADKIGFISFIDLISGKRTLKRVFSILFIGVLVFYMSSTGFSFLGLVTSDENGESPISKISGNFFDGDGNVELLDDTNVMGDPTEVDLGKKKVEIELGTEADQIDLSKEGELSGNQGPGKDFAGKVGAEQDSSFSDNINVDEQEIVEKFYNNLNK